MRLRNLNQRLPINLVRRQCQTFSKYYEDGIVHVISLNDITKEKVTMRLSKTSKKVTTFIMNCLVIRIGKWNNSHDYKQFTATSY
jgi:hypothetical protein